MARPSRARPPAAPRRRSRPAPGAFLRRVSARSIRPVIVRPRRCRGRPTPMAFRPRPDDPPSDRTCAFRSVPRPAVRRPFRRASSAFSARRSRDCRRHDPDLPRMFDPLCARRARQLGTAGRKGQMRALRPCLVPGAPSGRRAGRSPPGGGEGAAPPPRRWPAQARRPERPRRWSRGPAAAARAPPQGPAIGNRAAPVERGGLPLDGIPHGAAGPRRGGLGGAGAPDRRAADRRAPAARHQIVAMWPPALKALRHPRPAGGHGRSGRRSGGRCGTLLRPAGH